MRRLLAVLGLGAAAAWSAAAAPLRVPMADAGPDRTLYTGDAANLFGEVSTPNGLPIVSWTWAVDSAPAGARWVLQGEQSASASFSAELAGDYALAFFACDAVACAVPDFAMLHVRDNLPPLAEGFASTRTTSVGQSVCFDGSASSDPEGGLVSWVWDFGDGVQAVGAQACHRFDFAGSFDVTLVVTDERSARDAERLTITVGSSAALPEPASAPLALLALAALTRCRRRAAPAPRRATD